MLIYDPRVKDIATLEILNNDFSGAQVEFYIVHTGIKGTFSSQSEVVPRYVVRMHALEFLRQRNCYTAEPAAIFNADLRSHFGFSKSPQYRGDCRHLAHSARIEILN